ncbi:MAG: DEAD/DEAH box helicase [Verrucomicrobiales bacterium]
MADPIQRALAELGYETPSPIQAQSIPLLLEGRDLLGCAQTGTGKTAAFSLPILHALHSHPKRTVAKQPRALVLTPTRELATQVGSSLKKYGTHLSIRHALVFGGVGQRPQVQAMRQGTDILVACPGRLLDLIDQGHIDLGGVEYFVLDEVDRMLDMGFLRDVKRIVSLLPKKRQSLFFSATLASSIVDLAHGILQDPASVTIAPESTTAEKVEQSVRFVKREDKRTMLMETLKSHPDGELAIVFSRTKYGSDKLARHLTKNGIKAEAIHGNRSQPQRDRTLDRFRKGGLPVLVATDVAARGVDVKAVTLVINFDLPKEPEAYVHRIGRTGRAGAKGMAVTYCTEEEFKELRAVEKQIKASLAIDENHQWHCRDTAADFSSRRPSPQATKKTTSGNRRRRTRRRRPASRG